MFAMAALLLVSCDKDEPTADSSFAMKASEADYGSTVCARIDTIVSGNLTSANGPHHWDNAHNWIISGVVRVKGTTLEIDPGTYIVAAEGVQGANGVLVITKDAQIDAEGTAEAPIVFTSYKLIDCDASTTALPGDFGGVILLGNAQVNTGSVTNVIEGLGDQPNVSDFYFGGIGTGGNGHSAGIMKYVRIEFAGRVLPTEGDNGVEINGLTMGGVGSGTELDYIQVSYGLDDAFEFFGGTVGGDHLIAFAQDDDGFDFDWGYQGTITRSLALANKNATHSGLPTPGVADSNGIELDNDALSSANTPLTRPTLEYISIFGVRACTDGGLLENGVHLRRNGRITMRNSTVSGYRTGIRLEGTLATPVAFNYIFSNVEANAFVTATTPSPITGVTQSLVTCPGNASSFGSTQPFYFTNNSPALNFPTTVSRTNGAFATGDTAWAGSWTKFVDFETVYE